MNLIVAESNWETYGTFQNSFHPKVLWLIGRLEWIKESDKDTKYLS